MYTARQGQCVGAITHVTSWGRKCVRPDGRGTGVKHRFQEGQLTVPCLTVGECSVHVTSWGRKCVWTGDGCETQIPGGAADCSMFNGRWMFCMYTARQGQCVGAITHVTAWGRKCVRPDGRGTGVIHRYQEGQQTVPCLTVGECSVYIVLDRLFITPYLFFTHKRRFMGTCESLCLSIFHNMSWPSHPHGQIWTMFSPTFVVHGPRVCQDLDPR